MGRRSARPWVCVFVACLASAGVCGGRRRWRQHKRVHVPGVKRLSKGQAAQAAELFGRIVAARPDEDESLLWLAAAQAQQDQLEAAVQTAKKALEAGLPPGRFYAGPRHILEPLVKAQAFQKLMADRAVRLVHGPMVGCVTDTSARFWLRTASESKVQVAVSHPRRLQQPRQSKPIRTKKDADYTAVLEVGHLEPNTAYHYAVIIDGKPVKREEPYRFRTFPAAGKGAAFTVGFGGGAGWVPPHERMWDTIAKHQPLAFLFLGDNVYIDTPTMPDIQRYCYYRRQSQPQFRRFVSATAIYAIWDDHDFGTNDCFPGPKVREPAWKLPVYHIFRQNWVNPGYGGGTDETPGCWFDFVIGDVHFLLTDGRYYREHPKRVEEPSMLGPVQKKWLLGRLKASKGTFKVLCSGTPWAYGAKPGSRDPWQGFKAERKEIFDFIEQNRIDGVILVSADRHRSDVWKLDRRVGYPLYEFESSRLTNQHRHGSMKNSQCLFSYNAKQSFGLLAFDTTKPDPGVTYRVINIDDKEIHTFTVTKSQLTPK
ncbi:MAG: alkaline phosphatase D family protein [Planctomycetota bacterium]